MIFQSTVYPNVIPVNGILQQYLVSGGAISAGDFVQFADAVASGTKTLIGVAPALAVQLNETDVLVVSKRTNSVINAVVVRFSGQSVSIGGITAIASGTSSKVYEAKSAAVLSPTQVVVGLGKTVSSGNSSNMGLFAEAALLSISGLDITASEPVTLSKITYNENGKVGDVNVIALSETSVLVVYGFDSGDTSISVHCHSYATAISVLDGVMAAGTAFQFGSGGFANAHAVRLSKTDVLTCVGAGSVYGGFVLRIDGTSIVQISKFNIDSSSADRPFIPVIAGNGKLLFVMELSNSSVKLAVRAGYYNAGNVTLGAITQISDIIIGNSSSMRTTAAVPITGGECAICAAGKTVLLTVNDDLTITAGAAVTIASNAIYLCMISETTVFFYGYASCPARIEGLTIIPGTITTPASADRLAAALYSESSGVVRVFGGSSASNGFANTETTMVQPYSNAAYGVASTGGAVGETIDVFLPKT